MEKIVELYGEIIAYVLVTGVILGAVVAIFYGDGALHDLISRVVIASS